MQCDETFQWIIRSERRKELLANLDQPLTAKQLSRRSNLSVDSCSYLFWECELHQLLYCLNESAGSSRVHWLTPRGVQYQKKLREALQLPDLEHRYPDMDWKLYGDICFRHRCAVIKVLSEPLRPVAIKQRAKEQNPALRMSANNVRDVIRILLDFGLLKPVWLRGDRHPAYELAGQGKKFRELLVNAHLLPRHSYRALKLPIAGHIDNLNLITNNSVVDSPVRGHVKNP